MAGVIFERRSRLEVEERKAGWGADEGGRLVRGAALTWALGERGDAGACAGRAGWAAARSWRVSRSAGRTGPSGAAWPRWAAAGQAGEVGLGLFSIFLSISIYSLISNLSQTKVDFKYEFEFKPQSIKSMHQHECNTKKN